jgi:hypothetical protein
MLSVNISAYKGNIPRNHVLVRIRRVIYTPDRASYYYYRTFSRGIVLIYHPVSNTTMPTGRRYLRLLAIHSLKLVRE